MATKETETPPPRVPPPPKRTTDEDEEETSSSLQAARDAVAEAQTALRRAAEALDDLEEA